MRSSGRCTGRPWFPLFLTSLLLGWSVAAGAQTLTVEPLELTFEVESDGPSPPQQFVEVTSSPLGQTFTAQIEVTIVGTEWVVLDKTSGVTPDSIGVTVDPGLLRTGQRSANLIISLAGTETKAFVQITAVIDGGGDGGGGNGGGGGDGEPVIDFQPAAFSFFSEGSDPAAQTLSVRNSGSGTLTYQLSISYPGPGPTGWLQADPTSGTSTGAFHDHEVSVEAEGLPPGQHEANINISGNGANSPTQVPVTLTVGATPTLVVEPDSLQFSTFEGGDSLAPQSLTISSANGTVSYEITTDQPWLSVQPSGGNTSSGEQFHEVAVEANGFSPGTFLGNISIESPQAGNSPSIVPVRLMVNPSGVLSVFPASLNFFGAAGTPLREKRLLNLFSGSMSGFEWSAEVSPPEATWLKLSPPQGGVPGNLLVEIDTTGLGPGERQAEIQVRPMSSASVTSGPTAVIAQGVPAVTAPVRVTLQNLAPSLSAQPQVLRFSALEDSPVAGQQILRIGNSGGDSLNWTADVNTEDGIDWLSILPSSGVAPTAATVSVIAEGLSPGVHMGYIRLSRPLGRRPAPGSSAAQEITVPVSFAVEPTAGILATDRVGALFHAVEGEANPQQKSVRVLNRGSGSLAWTARVRELAGGAVWLSVSPRNGLTPAFAEAEEASQITLTANSSGLETGIHTALVELTASAAGSPRLLTVVMNVRPEPGTSRAALDSGGLFFVLDNGGPASREIEVAPRRSGSVEFRAATSTFDGGGWLGVEPSGGMAPAGESFMLEVEASSEGLPPGLYRGLVSITFGDGVVQSAPVSLIVPAGDAQSCVPAGAAVVPLSSFQNFSVSSGQPVPLEVMVADTNCGIGVSSAAVLADFSNGDRALALEHVGGGRFAGDWAPRNAGPDVNVRFTAVAGAFQSQASLVGTVANAVAPQLSRNGTVNGASFAVGEPLAPGGIFSSFGFNLASGNFAAGSIPLPSELGGLSLLIGGRQAPLYFAGFGQVNAQLPFAVSPGNTQALVRAGGRHSIPVEVTIARARPGVFLNILTGEPNRAIAQNQDLSLNTPENPAAPGEAVTIYLTGVGEVDPAVLTGAGAPALEPLARAALPASATIGGQEAEILFLGLTPNFVGLGQANLLVPETALAGSDVEVKIMVAGQPANRVLISVQAEQ